MSRFAICAPDGTVTTVIATTDETFLGLNTPTDHNAVPIPDDVLAMPETCRWNGAEFEPVATQ